ncbi:hypothetical protein Pmar_PMAR010278 [Perkinsus marinus ATCC 50983]|uniref:FCP1 homology domain-containing protein n=1 Tax=Perkinsus marinus (strain ATCC 50983 / TXsc) TaxID=423536 RepID=C5K5B0_PERM5|nr:hypothetical protein Pmar_PMAR010278 [Perkinsus marinus ATCC 50983]EER20532.1 hypothetical protein Pmar_PMAR010278 [Perkinsus marinus ATCC 50983]|eukprot:XP_002788736.1 hypothetical protein Pmar_PMAR010278 [Perkinsus marinus ATCC 50983]
MTDSKHCSALEDSSRVDVVAGDTGGPGGDTQGTIYQKTPVRAEKLLNIMLQQLSCAEHVAFNLLDGVRCDATHVSFFCREYFNTAALDAGLTMAKYSSSVASVEGRLKRQIKMAMVLEMCAVAVCAGVCAVTAQTSDWAQLVPLVVKARLRALLQHVHENVLLLIDYVCQKAVEFPGDLETNPYSIVNFDLNILYLAKRYRAMGKAGHSNALSQNNSEAENLLRQVCRTLSGAPTTRGRRPSSAMNSLGGQVAALVTEVLDMAHKNSLSNIRSKFLQSLRFRPVEGPVYERYEKVPTASDSRASVAAAITAYFEPLPPMLPHLIRMRPLLPPQHCGVSGYTAVIDLDETLVHYSEVEGGSGGRFEMRPGCVEFLSGLNALGYEIVVFTAATQDYADWVVDQLETLRGVVVHHRLYRQHALPWGPIFIKDLARLGRKLDRSIILDNVKENFMLQPENGIFIYPWYSERDDTALYDLLPLFQELIVTRVSVPSLLHKYSEEIPSWAGFDGVEMEECGVANQLALAAATIPEDGGVLDPSNKITGAFQAPPPPVATSHSAAVAYQQPRTLSDSQRFPGTPMRVYDTTRTDKSVVDTAPRHEEAEGRHRVVVTRSQPSPPNRSTVVQGASMTGPYTGRYVYGGPVTATPSMAATTTTSHHASSQRAIYMGSPVIPPTPAVAHRQIFQLGLPPLTPSLFSAPYQPQQSVTVSQPFTVRVQPATRAIGAMPASPVMGTRMIMSATNRAAQQQRSHAVSHQTNPRPVVSWPMAAGPSVPPSPLVGSRIITNPGLLSSVWLHHPQPQQMTTAHPSTIIRL